MKSFHWILFVATFTACFAATPPKKQAGKKAAVTTKGKTAKKAAAKPAAAATGKVKARKGRGPSKPVASAWRSHQLTPTSDRYREIQQSLTEKGYLKTEPNGVWDANSIDAMRQFQTDNKLSPTGKLSASTLIGLGLGPQHSADPVMPFPAAPRP